MTSMAHTSEGQFVDVGCGFHGVLVSSRVFLQSRWMMLEKVLGDVASRCWCVLVAKSSHTGVDVDGLACPCAVLRPVTVRQGNMASRPALSCPVV
jgi:hypothetical protein